MVDGDRLDALTSCPTKTARQWGRRGAAMADNKKKVVVIGAGMVGVCAASYIQQAGHDVVIVDPNPPGEGASFGNAGCFNPSSLVPIAGPDTLKRVPGYLSDPLGPLAIRWSYLPKLAPWLLRYAYAGASSARVAKQAEALKSLISQSLDALMPLVKNAQAQALVRRDGILIAYRSEKSWQADERAWEIRRRNGLKWDDLNADELRQFDPSLARDLIRAKYVPGNGHTVDPRALVAALADAFVADGGELRRTRAVGFDIDGERLRAVRTPEGAIAADAAIVAAGAYSKPLAAMVGDRVPLETERGYHLMVKQSAVMPRVPTTDAEFSFVATPMAAGLRLAGTVELAGLDAPPNWQRSRMLLARAANLLPGLPASLPDDRLSMWMGHRPSLPDSLPVLGRSRRSPDVLLAFGHGHVGMTAAPYTGVVLADLVSGRSPQIDLTPFRSDRFGFGPV
jgi:D-amino-acid dehydrogenase